MPRKYSHKNVRITPHSSPQDINQKLVRLLDSVLDKLLSALEHGGTNTKWLMILVTDAATHWMLNFLFPKGTHCDGILGFPLLDAFSGFLALECLAGWGIEIIKGVARSYH
jgi:hypothetical protein